MNRKYDLCAARSLIFLLNLSQSCFHSNGIKTLALYPNPNNGTFTVNVEFYNKQNASIQIWDISPTKYFQQNFIDRAVITLPISLPQLVNGTYLLRVIGEYNAKHLNFIISH